MGRKAPTVLRTETKTTRNMIYDNIKNIETYAGISSDILAGLSFLKGAKADMENGVYQINPRVKAIVSEYTTKPVNENGYEAHRQYIDIQFVLKGRERVCCLPLEKLKVTKPYSEADDAALYDVSETTDCPEQQMVIGEGYFAVFYPQDGHMPQLCVAAPEAVKKVVVKVKL